MGKNIWLLGLIIVLLATPTVNIKAQFKPATVEKSNQKTIFQGKVYYIHHVLESQTLYSISRAYGVTPQDIAAANPNITLEVIQPGQSLKIPAVSTLDTLSPSYFELSEKDFYYHTVRAQQTITYLTHKYSVSKELIYKYNPGTEDILQIGQKIKIPKPSLIAKLETEKTAAQIPNSYKVKAGDTLYSLAKRFGYSVAEIIELNPNLRWGLKTNMLISIPNLTEIYSTPLASTDSTSDSLFNRLPLYTSEQCDSVRLNNSSKALKIVLMLPFYAKETLTLDSISNDSIKQNSPYSKNKVIGKSFIEFYEGFLLALDSIKTTNQDVTLFTYDTRYDTIETDKILQELEIIKPDLIVGPVNALNIKRVSEFSDSNNIPLILPLSRSNIKLTTTNPYAITLLPDFNTEMDLASDFLSQYNDKNIILIHNQHNTGMDKLDVFRKSLFAHFSSKSIYEQALYKEIRINDTLKKNLTHTLREDVENIIIIISNNEAYVSNILGLLTIQNTEYKIRVFGLPSWLSFKNLRVDQLHSLNTLIYSPFFIDYNKPSTQRFIELSRRKLGFEPYKTVGNGNGFNFSYLGYETGLLFTQAFSNYGTEFINCLCEINEPMPQLDYEFNINSWGGFKVNSINIINFTDDFNLIKVPHTFSENNKTKLGNDKNPSLPVTHGLYNPIDY